MHAGLAVSDCIILADSYTHMKEQINLLQVVADNFSVHCYKHVATNMIKTS